MQSHKIGEVGTIAVWFSCGAASAVAAMKTIEKYGATHIIKVLNTPIQEEDSDNRRFLRDVEDWLGIEIEIVTNFKYPDSSCQEVWEERRYMGGVSGAPCTLWLKKHARYQYEMDHDIEWHVLGFVKGEEKRLNNFIANERANTLPVLIEDGITKADCYQIIQQAGIRLPRMYELGYPNANCIGCVKATSPTYWNHVRKVHPHVFESRASFSREIGAKLVRVGGKRIFLDELRHDAIGNPLKNMDVECGIFCTTE